MGKFLDFIKRIPIPPGFARFPEVKVLFFLVFLVHVHFFSLYFLLGSISGILVRNVNECSVNTISDYTLPSILYGLTWALAPIPGFLADRYWGRHKVISACFLFSFVGTILLIILESVRLNFTQGHCGIVVVFYSISYLMLALGSSGVLVQMIPYGVDQIQGANEATLSSYFYWYVWCSFAAKMTVYGQYIYFGDTSKNIQEGLLILGNGFVAILALFAAICIYKFSRIINYLVPVAPISNPLKLVYNVIKNAYRTRKYCDPAMKMYSKRDWIDYAMFDVGGGFSHEQVNNVKTLINMLPIMVFLIWLYSLTNEFPYDLFIAQGVQMDHSGIPKALPQILCYSITGATILTVIPIIEVPWIGSKMRKIFPTILSRLYFGTGVLIIAYVTACMLEITRLLSCDSSGALNIPIALQIPQYVLIGIGSVFILVNAFEFVYAQSPLLMKGFVFGVLSFMYGLGSLLPTLLYEILIQFGSNHDGKFVCNQTIIAIYKSDMLEECEEKCNKSYIAFVLITFLSILHVVIFGILIYRYKYWNRNQIGNDLRCFSPTNNIPSVIN